MCVSVCLSERVCMGLVKCELRVSVYVFVCIRVFV